MGDPEIGEQAVLVYIKLSNDAFGTREEMDNVLLLAEQLERAITERGVGIFDGNDIGQGIMTLYMYGPSADELLDVIVPVIDHHSVPQGSYAVKIYGEEGRYGESPDGGERVEL